MFNNSHNVVIGGGTFNLTQHRASAFVQLRGTIADGAMHNSGERFDPPKCYPGTRVAILETLLNWIIANDRGDFMRWLFGSAGAGKSSILQKIAELCAESERNLLIASFFFSRTAALRNDEKRLITTIAYQLALSIPETRPYIEAAIEHDPAFFSMSLQCQLQSLVVEPLNQAYASVGEEHIRWPHLIVVDGLDECGSPAMQKYILICLRNSAADCRFPILFLVSSRPETHLLLTFNQDVFKLGCSRTALDDDYRGEADIRLFLEGTFRDIKETHPLHTYLPASWPLPTVIDDLVRKSSGQFIYPATVARFISPPDSHPAQRLDIVLGISALGSGHETPFAELDALYSHILSSLHKQTSSQIVALLMFPGNEVSWTPERIDSFLGLLPGSAEHIVNKLASVIKLDLMRRIQILHASLPDFLYDEKRSQQFYINLPEEATYFAKLCLKHFASGSNKTAHEDAIIRIEAYCKQALPTEQLRECFIQLDLPVIVRQEIIPRREPQRDMHSSEKAPLSRIMEKYVTAAGIVKFPDVHIVTHCEQVVKQFIESEALLYRSTSPTLLILLVLCSVEPDLLRAPRFNLHDRMWMPCSGVDFLLAPTQHREFERSILIDDTSLWLRGDGLKEFYTQFLQNHLSSNDFAIAATWVASFIADFSSQSTWSSITEEDCRRASVSGWNMVTTVTTISKKDFDNTILTMKHQAYEQAIRYLPLLLPKASPDSALSNVLRRTTVRVPDVSQWSNHTSTTVIRWDNCRIVSTPNGIPFVLGEKHFMAEYREKAEREISRYLARNESPELLPANEMGPCPKGKDLLGSMVQGVAMDSDRSNAPERCQVALSVGAICQGVWREITIILWTEVFTDVTILFLAICFLEYVQ